MMGLYSATTFAISTDFFFGIGLVYGLGFAFCVL